MKLQVNGEQHEWDESGGADILSLLKSRGVEQPSQVSVQLNGEIIASVRYESQSLKEGDEVEFLYFMGGGA